jgi:DNA-binding response OmpR family regulator
MQPACPGTDTPRDEAPLRVLVVEDDEDTAASMALLLRLDGHEVRVAGEGGAALREAQDRPPDVVLLDIGLPGLDGYEVAKRLRERAAGKQPLVIAVTGRDQDEARRRSAEAGIDLHLLKPADPDGLRQMLKRWHRTIGK